MDPIWHVPPGQQAPAAAPQDWQKPPIAVLQPRLAPQVLFAQQGWFDPPQSSQTVEALQWTDGGVAAVS
jgi:hypothetical protein